jgi:hypothetical protein
VDSTIIAKIEEFGPRSLLEVSNSASAEIKEFCNQKGISYQLVAPQDVQQVSQPADLAVVHDAFENVPLAEGRQILGYLRNSLTHSIWLLLESNADWPLSEFIALGFKKHQDLIPPESNLRSYTYDLNSYNHKRSWNNPRFWANPENFQKYRW